MSSGIVFFVAHPTVCVLRNGYMIRKEGRRGFNVLILSSPLLSKYSLLLLILQYQFICSC